MAEQYKGDHTGMISKHPVDSLHTGHIESPLKASAMQEVKEGGAKNGGMRQSMPKGMGRSVAKEMEYAEKKKLK